MGRNNREPRGQNWGYNETKKTPFTFVKFLNENDCRMLEVANGLQIKDVSMAIQIDGHTNIELKDKLTLKGQTRLVIALTPTTDNPNQGRYKGSLDTFTGSIRVGLK